MIEKVLLTIGLAVQLAGAYITYRGFRQGWDETKSPSDRFLAPIIRILDRVGTMLSTLISRLRRKPDPVEMRSGSGVGLRTSGRGHVAKIWGPIDDKITDREAINQLNDRIRSVQDDIARNDKRASEHEQTLDEFIADLTQNLQAEEEEARGRAISGLRKEAFGFLVLTLGSLIQGVGSYFG